MATVFALKKKHFKASRFGPAFAALVLQWIVVTPLDNSSGEWDAVFPEMGPFSRLSRCLRHLTSRSWRLQRLDAPADSREFATPATPRPRPLVIGDHGSVVGHEIFVISSEITRIDDDDDTNSRGRWIVLIFNTIMITSWRKEME